MTVKMSNSEDGDINKHKINGLSKHDREDDHNLELDDTLTALLASTLLSPDIENINDLSQIAGEYSSLNNTIDELNRYLDRWDERHAQLRAHIQEAIQANEEEQRECVQESEDQDDSCDVGDSTEGNGGESVSKEEQPQDDSDKH